MLAKRAVPDTERKAGAESGWLSSKRKFHLSTLVCNSGEERSGWLCSY